MAPNPKAVLAKQLFESGRLDAARAHVARWIASAPKDVSAQQCMAQILVNLGKPQQALFYAQRGVELAPHEPTLWILLARVHGMLHHTDKAVHAADAAAALAPGLVEPHEVAALTLAGAGRFLTARQRCEAGLAMAPNDVMLRTTLANTNLDTGRVEEAVAGLKRLMDERPDDAHTADVLCNVLNYDPSADKAYVRRIHETYGRILLRRRPEALPGLVVRPRKAGAALRVGLVSPDFRNHSCGFFIEPLFEFHDRARMELYAYHTNFATDEVSERLKKHATIWRHLYSGSDESITRMLREDRIDVAIDLSGHTRGESLVAFHLRCAPVQVTYLGYPNITGVESIDARIVDSWTDPAGSDEGDGVHERLIRIDPCFLCFRPPAEMPQPGPPPSTAKCYVTFGSCNAIQKINQRVLALWAKVLGAVPGSRLLLKAANLREEALCAEVRARMGVLGVSQDRLAIMGPLPDRRDHLRTYDDIDVALDPFPYNGTTTTCDAFCMGVPVVTRVGDTHASRVGVTLCRAIGHAEWIAHDDEKYVMIAAGLARDESRRSVLRQSLRSEMQASLLCDGRGFAERFTAALETLYNDRMGAVL